MSGAAERHVGLTPRRSQRARSADYSLHVRDWPAFRIYSASGDLKLLRVGQNKHSDTRNSVMLTTLRTLVLASLVVGLVSFANAGSASAGGYGGYGYAGGYGAA